MDKEKLMKQLQEINEEIVKRYIGSDEFTNMINKRIQTFMETLQKQLQGDSTAGAIADAQPSSLPFVQATLPYANVRGNLIVTRQGSVLDITKKTPWVQVSKEVQDWASDFLQYVQSRGRVVGKTLQESEDPSGGYLVPEEFRATILMYDAEPAIVWPRATVWPMATDKLGMPKLAQSPDGIENDDYDHFAGVAFTWTDEGGSKTETEPDFEFIELIAHELSGYTAITNTLMDDSPINLMNFLTTLFRGAWVWQTDKAFIRQDGANKPLGVTKDPSVLSVNRNTASTVKYADLLNMVKKLPSVFDAGAVWFFNKEVHAAIRNERDNNNALLLQQTYDSAAGKMIEILLGYPVVKSDGKTYPMGTKGDVILGNWAYYYIGDRQEFRLDTSEHYLFRSNKLAIRVASRLDGQPAIPEAFVVLDDVASAS